MNSDSNPELPNASLTASEQPVPSPSVTSTGDGTPPTGDGTPPTGDGTPPTGDGTPPTGDGTPPTGDGTPPTGDGTPPTGDGTPPTGDGTPPTGDGTPPTGDGTPPTGDGTPPTGDGTPPPSASAYPLISVGIDIIIDLLISLHEANETSKGKVAEELTKAIQDEFVARREVTYQKDCDPDKSKNLAFSFHSEAVHSVLPQKDQDALKSMAAHVNSLMAVGEIMCCSRKDCSCCARRGLTCPNPSLLIRR